MPSHDTPLSSILLLAAVMCAARPLFSQCCLQNLIYCPAFLGAIHCTNLRRPAESLLTSIFFCQLLRRLHYSHSISFPTISGHMAKLPTMITYSISLSSSVDVYCIWVSPWIHLISSSAKHVSSSSPISSCMQSSCPPGYLPPLSSYDPPPKPPFGCIFLPRCTTFLPNILSSVLLYL